MRRGEAEMVVPTRVVRELVEGVVERGDVRVTEYVLNPGDEPHEWVRVALTCFAGQGPHKPPEDTWAVRWLSYCLDADGEWVFEPQPSSRDDEFFARTRWSRDEALRRGRAAVPAGARETDPRPEGADKP